MQRGRHAASLTHLTRRWGNARPVRLVARAVALTEASPLHAFRAASRAFTSSPVTLSSAPPSHDASLAEAATFAEWLLKPDTVQFVGARCPPRCVDDAPVQVATSLLRLQLRGAEAGANTPALEQRLTAFFADPTYDPALPDVLAGFKAGLAQLQAATAAAQRAAAAGASARAGGVGRRRLTPTDDVSAGSRAELLAGYTVLANALLHGCTSTLAGVVASGQGRGRSGVAASSAVGMVWMHCFRAASSASGPAAVRLQPGASPLNAWLDCLVQLGKPAEALSVFERAWSLGLHPTASTLRTVIQAASDMDDFTRVQKLWTQLTTGQPPAVPAVEPNVPAYNAFIRAAGRAGLRGVAFHTVDRMRRAGLTADEDTYCQLMLAASYTGRPRLAFSVFDDLGRAGVAITEAAYITLLTVATHSGDRELLKEALQAVMAALDPSSSSSLTTASTPQLSMSTALSTALVLAAEASDALELAYEWLQDWRAAQLLSASPHSHPSTVPYATVLSICSTFIARQMASQEAGWQRVDEDEDDTGEGNSSASGVGPTSAVATQLARLLPSGGRVKTAQDAWALAGEVYRQLLQEDGLTPDLRVLLPVVRMHVLVPGHFPSALKFLDDADAAAVAAEAASGAVEDASEGHMSPTAAALAEVYWPVLRCWGLLGHEVVTGAGEADGVMQGAAALLRRFATVSGCASPPLPLLHAYLLACGDGGDAAAALQLVAEMEAKWKRAPTVATYEAALGACVGAGAPDAAFTLLTGMVHRGLTPSPAMQTMVEQIQKQAQQKQVAASSKAKRRGSAGRRGGSAAASAGDDEEPSAGQGAPDAVADVLTPSSASESTTPTELVSISARHAKLRARRRARLASAAEASEETAGDGQAPLEEGLTPPEEGVYSRPAPREGIEAGGLFIGLDAPAPGERPQPHSDDALYGDLDGGHSSNDGSGARSGSDSSAAVSSSGKTSGARERSFVEKNFSGGWASFPSAVVATRPGGGAGGKGGKPGSAPTHVKVDNVVIPVPVSLRGKSEAAWSGKKLAGIPAQPEAGEDDEDEDEEGASSNEAGRKSGVKPPRGFKLLQEEIRRGPAAVKVLAGGGESFMFSSEKDAARAVAAAFGIRLPGGGRSAGRSSEAGGRGASGPASRSARLRAAASDVLGMSEGSHSSGAAAAADEVEGEGLFGGEADEEACFAGAWDGDVPLIEGDLGEGYEDEDEVSSGGSGSKASSSSGGALKGYARAYAARMARGTYSGSAEEEAVAAGAVAARKAVDAAGATKAASTPQPAVAAAPRSRRVGALFGDDEDVAPPAPARTARKPAPKSK